MKNETPAFLAVKKKMQDAMNDLTRQSGEMANTADLKSSGLKDLKGSTPFSGTFSSCSSPSGKSHEWIKDYFIREPLGPRTCSPIDNLFCSDEPIGQHFYDNIDYSKDYTWLGFDRRLNKVDREKLVEQRNEINRTLSSADYQKDPSAKECASQPMKQHILFFNTKLDKPYGTLRFVEDRIHLTQQKDKKTYHTVELNEDSLRDILHHSNQLHDYTSMAAHVQQEQKKEQTKFLESRIKQLEEQIKSLQKEKDSVNS